MKDSDFYGKFSSGASFNKEKDSFFSEKNIFSVEKEIFSNCKKMKLNHLDLQDKIIMNVGSGREALALLQFNPKKIYHYDISNVNINNFKKIIMKKKLEKEIVSKQLDLSKDKLPSNKFDFIYLHGIIQHVDNVSSAMINLSNSLRENGFMWFYFYRPGSLVVFLGSVQRFLLKKTNIKFFNMFLKKHFSHEFADRILDDCFVPNRQLFYPRDYIKCLENNNIKIYGDSCLTNKKKNYDFKRFHESVVLYTKKENKNQMNDNLESSLDPSNDIDVLNPIIYKEENEILEIIRLINTKDLTQSNNMNKLIAGIEKLKEDFSKIIFKSGFVEKKYVESTLNKVILLLNN